VAISRMRNLKWGRKPDVLVPPSSGLCWSGSGTVERIVFEVGFGKGAVTGSEHLFLSESHLHAVMSASHDS
jgi:hypothetical protein